MTPRLLEAFLRLNGPEFSELREFLQKRQAEEVAVMAKDASDRNRNLAAGKWQLLEELQDLISGAATHLNKKAR